MLTEPIIEEYRRAKAALLAEYPELAFDSEALSDTLDGSTDAQDLIAKLVRQSLETQAAADGLGGLISDYGLRHDRMEAKAAALKNAAFKIMQAIGERSIKRPEFTLTVHPSRPAVIVTDPDALPTEFIRVKAEPDKKAIAEALKAGPVPGATLSNGGDCLTVRVK